MIQGTCSHCGKSFEAKRATRKYCSSTCRANASTGRAPVAQLPTPEPSANSLVDEVRRELEAGGRLETALGQQALVLAEACYPGAPQLAAVSKELRDVRAAALEGVNIQVDPVDELRRRRDDKRNNTG